MNDADFNKECQKNKGLIKDASVMKYYDNKHRTKLPMNSSKVNIGTVQLNSMVKLGDQCLMHHKC